MPAFLIRKPFQWVDQEFVTTHFRAPRCKRDQDFTVLFYGIRNDFGAPPRGLGRRDQSHPTSRLVRVLGNFLPKSDHADDADHPSSTCAIPLAPRKRRFFQSADRRGADPRRAIILTRRRSQPGLRRMIGCSPPNIARQGPSRPPRQQLRRNRQASDCHPLSLFLWEEVRLRGALRAMHLLFAPARRRLDRARKAAAQNLAALARSSPVRC